MVCPELCRGEENSDCNAQQARTMGFSLAHGKSQASARRDFRELKIRRERIKHHQRQGGGYAATLLRKRLFAAAAAVAFLFLAVAFRFFWIQVVEGDALRSRAFGQWTREIPVTAARGEIYDANGVLLADNAAAYAVYARPNAVKDKRRAAEVLAGLFGLDEA